MNNKLNLMIFILFMSSLLTVTYLTFQNLQSDSELALSDGHADESTVPMRGPVMNLERLTSNVKDAKGMRCPGSENSFLKVKVSLLFAIKSAKYEQATRQDRKVMDRELLELYQERVPHFKEIITQTITDFQFVGLGNPEEKNMLKHIIKTKINDTLMGHKYVDVVNFTEFLWTNED